MDNGGRLYTLQELGDTLHVSYSALRRWIQGGQLRVIKLPGGQLRIPPAEVKRLLADTPAEKGLVRIGKV